MHSLVATSSVVEGNGGAYAPANATPVNEECLETFMSGFSQTLAADALLVTSHHATDPPVLLFSDGKATTDSVVTETLLRCAARNLDAPISRPGGISCSDEGPAGTVMSATLLLAGVAISITTLLHDERSGRLSAGRARLEGLLPFAWPFLRMWSQRRDASHRLFGLEAALHNTYSSTLLLDPAGHLLFANNSAQAFLTAGRGLAVNRGRLTASSLTETLRLAATIEHLCSLTGATRKQHRSWQSGVGTCAPCWCPWR